MTQIATTILNQLSPQGTRGLRLMLGAELFIAGPNSVSFRFKGSRKMDHARIVLNGTDTYDLTLARVHGTKVTTVAEHTGVYAGDLQEIFETATGLRTSLPWITVEQAAKT